MDKHLYTEVYVFKGQVNDGKSLTLTTDYFSNGDAGISITQKLTLQSYYSDSASFELYGTTLTPESLRELADILENGKKLAVARATATIY